MVDYHLRLEILSYLLSGNRIVGLPPVSKEKKSKRSIEEDAELNAGEELGDRDIARLVKAHLEQEMKLALDYNNGDEEDDKNVERGSPDDHDSSSNHEDSKERVARGLQEQEQKQKKQKQKPLFCEMGSSIIDVSVLVRAIRLTEDNLHPAKPNGFVLSTALGILFLFLISSSSASLVFNGVQPLHAAKVKGWQIACCRVAHGMFNALMISLSFSLCVLSFGADMKNGFMAYWMWCWLLSVVWVS